MFCNLDLDAKSLFTGPVNYGTFGERPNREDIAKMGKRSVRLPSAIADTTFMKMYAIYQFSLLTNVVNSRAVCRHNTGHV